MDNHKPVQHQTLKLSKDNDAHHFSKVILFGIATFLIIVCAISAGYFFGASNVPFAISIKTPPTISPTPLPDLTENWITYTNETLGFSVKHPTNYTFSKETATFALIDVPNSFGFLRIANSFTDHAKINPCVTDGEEGVDFTYPCIPKNSTKMEIILDGKNAVKFRALNSAVHGDTIVVQTIENPKMEIMMGVAGGGLEKDFENILSSFRFSTPANTFTPAQAGPTATQSATLETGPETSCKVNTDCYCRIFTGAYFIPGKTQGVCDTTTNTCKKCMYL